MKETPTLVMLPNDTSIDRNNAPIYKADGKLILNVQGDLDVEWRNCTYYHLYQVSDDAIKEGDWYLEDESKFGGNYSSPVQAKSDGDCGPKDIKVTATTLKSLSLPEIPESVVYQYVEANGETDVFDIKRTHD